MMPPDDRVTKAEEWRAPRVDPLTYPGAAPRGHFLLLDGDVHPVVLDEGDPLRARLGDGRFVDEVLEDAGLSLLRDRVAVVAYGANRSPHTLAIKLDHHGYVSSGSRIAVPVLAGRLRGYDVVVGGVSSQGCLYADLTPSPGTTVNVHLTLFDAGQARAVHESEGVGRELYVCAKLPEFSINDTPSLVAPITYAGCNPVLELPNGRGPLAFAAIDAEGRSFTAVRQDEALAMLVDVASLETEVTDLLGGPDDSADDLAREIVACLSGSWWYTHNTGAEPTHSARRIRELLAAAICAHGAQRTTAEHFADGDRVLETEVAYACDTDQHLGALLESSGPDS